MILLNIINLCGTHATYTYTIFEKLCARLRVQKKMEQSYLDESVFAMVFLRAKDIDEAVFNMLFWTPDFLFINDLGLTNPENFFSLSRESEFEMRMPQAFA